MTQEQDATNGKDESTKIRDAVSAVDEKAWKAAKFLFEESDKEADRFWTRMSIFLAINTAAIGALLAWLSRTPRPPGLLANCFSVLGFLVSLVWLRITWRSTTLNTDWFNAACKVVERYNQKSLIVG